MKPEAPYCCGKRAYDKKGAVTAANRRWEEDHIELRVYKCNFGDHWHLTKQLRGRYYGKRVNKRYSYSRR